MIGLEEILEGKQVKRRHTVTCNLNGSVTYFIKKDDFINCTNLFKFADKIQQEKVLKQSLLS